MYENGTLKEGAGLVLGGAAVTSISQEARRDDDAVSERWVCMCLREYVYVCACVLRACVCVCVCVCVSMYTHVCM